MMEAMLCNELIRLRMGDVYVESAGIMEGMEGKNINEHAARELARRGLNLSDHQSRSIGTIGDLKEFYLILCIGEDEADYVRSIGLEMQHRIEVVNAASGGIPDPCGFGPEAYRICAETIERAMRIVAEDLSQK